MSSNIRVTRICEYCSQDFIAKTTTTRFCSDKCRKTAHKAALKNKKIERSNTETLKIKTVPVEIIKAKDFLTVNDVAALLNLSRRTAYRLISTGVIPAVNLSERKTIIKRSEIDKIFEQQSPINSNVTVAENPQYQLEDCYTLKEIETIYNLTEGVVHALIKRNGIPKIKKGRYAYAPKQLIDRILNTENKTKN